GGLHRARRAVVVVPGGDRGDRHDRLQPVHAGGGDAVGDGAVPGLADHADRAGGPVRLLGLAAGRRGVAGGPAVEPVDHRLGGGDLVLAAHVLAAVGPGRARQVDLHDRVAARHEVVVVEQREADDVAVGVVGLLLALVAAPAALVVRAGVHDHRDLDALVGGLARPDDVRGHARGAAVRVRN